MISIEAIDRQGQSHLIEAPVDMGLNLMEVCKAAELPMEGTCGKQFNFMSRAAQKSFARGREFGGWLLKDGGVEMWTGPSTKSKSEISPKSAGATGFFHTYPNHGGSPTKGYWEPSHSTTDISNTDYFKVNSNVVGRQDYYSQAPFSTPVLVHTSSYFSPYPYNYYWWKFLNAMSPGPSPGQ